MEIAKVEEEEPVTVPSPCARTIEVLSALDRRGLRRWRRRTGQPALRAECSDGLAGNRDRNTWSVA